MPLAAVCSYGSCEKPLLIVAICVIAAFILIVPGCYCAVLYKLKSIAYSEKMHNEPEITKKKMYKFFYYGAHLGLYALISALILVGACIILHNVWLYNTIRGSMQHDCDIVGYLDTLVRLETLAGGAVLLWLVRIVFDVVIT
ncbi:hypothetical protein OESDEN_10634, partial [Oesophagostomum dentatum]